MAFGTGTISDISAGISDLYQIGADKAKAQFDITEGEEYSDAAVLAQQNAQFTQMSTAIKTAQTQREISKSIGATTAAVAGGGFATSGSALDIIRESTQQGALTKAVGEQQGLVTEAGYNEQATSYNLMAGAATQAAAAEQKAAKGAMIGAGLQFAGAAVSLIPGDPASTIGGAIGNAVIPSFTPT